MLGIFAGTLCLVMAQLVPDRDFSPPIDKPAFAPGSDPKVGVDEAHNNFHTASGRYQTFAELLRRDGYDVSGLAEPISASALRGVNILVIANALHASNASNWKLPTPSAFTPAEIAALVLWVRAGGSLFLIADHMPFPGAAGELARALGAQFQNGYARSISRKSSADVFSHSEGTLRPHEVTKGIDSVATFGGSAFRLERPGSPILVFDSSFTSWNVAQASQFSADTPKVPVEGWLQGAVLQLDRGRVAVFGEAAMFSAQLAGPNKGPMGMNHPLAAQNPTLLRNVMRWLAGR